MSTPQQLHRHRMSGKDGSTNTVTSVSILWARIVDVTTSKTRNVIMQVSCQLLKHGTTSITCNVSMVKVSLNSCSSQMLEWHCNHNNTNGVNLKDTFLMKLGLDTPKPSLFVVSLCTSSLTGEAHSLKTQTRVTTFTNWCRASVSLDHISYILGTACQYPTNDSKPASCSKTSSGVPGLTTVKPGGETHGSTLASSGSTSSPQGSTSAAQGSTPGASGSTKAEQPGQSTTSPAGQKKRQAQPKDLFKFLLLKYRKG